jgi:putative transposase
MKCVACDGEAISEWPERTAQGYRRFRCRVCGKRFNERTGGSLDRTQYPSDVIALVVFGRLRYKLSLRDLPEKRQKRGRTGSVPATSWGASAVVPLRGRGEPGHGCAARHPPVHLPADGNP